MAPSTAPIYYRRALAVKPSSVDARRNLARLKGQLPERLQSWLEQGALTRVETLCRTLLKEDEDFAQARFFLSVSLFKQGRYGESIEQKQTPAQKSSRFFGRLSAAGQCPRNQRTISRGQSGLSGVGFESFDIWDAMRRNRLRMMPRGPAADGRSESARVQHVVTDADPFDDSMWERIPGVGSNEPVAAVIEDSLFARTGAGWDISQTLAGPTTELEQPGEPPGTTAAIRCSMHTVGQDDGDDDADEGTADDETDISLTGAAGYSESEGWQDESDSDLPGFRDEFEPIEATRADLLEFNAPEDTWSSIFTPAQLEDTSEDWLDEDEDEDPDTGWPALGSETEGNDLVGA